MKKFIMPQLDVVKYEAEESIAVSLVFMPEEVDISAVKSIDFEAIAELFTEL